MKATTLVILGLPVCFSVGCDSNRSTERQKEQIEKSTEQAKAQAEADKEKAEAREDAAKAQLEADKKKADAAADAARADGDANRSDGGSDTAPAPAPDR